MGETSKPPKEHYVYLDFSEKVDQDFFNNPDLFFKIVNLHTKSPLVQLGNYVFRGEYQDTIGTNVFLKETDEEDEFNPFEKKSPIKLEYLTKTFKYINLKYLELSEEITPTDLHDIVPINLKQDYKETLKKYKESKLNICDLDVKKKIESGSKVTEKSAPIKTNESEASTSENKQDSVGNLNLSSKTNANQPNTTSKLFDLLEQAAKIPTKQTKTYDKLLESKKIDAKNTKNFLVLKQLYLQNLSYKDVQTKVEVERVEDYVDLQSSIEDGIILSRNFGEVALTEEEKNKLISMQNIHNLSVPLQLAFLVEQLRLEKANLALLNDDEKEGIDDYGRTPKDRYRLLKTFAKDVWYQLFVRLSKT